ncbi:MAG: hypothetical protein AB7T06_39720 [Kofleriaceae bacterium]
MRRVLLSVLLLAACTKAGPESRDEPVPVANAEAVIRVDSVPAVSPTPPPAKPTPKPTKPTPPNARVELTAVTLADDCGGAPPWAAPRSSVAPSSRSDDSRAKGARARKRCEQTSMQLAITTNANAKLHVKSVKLYDESGKLVGTLTASQPTKWSATDSRYQAWDESVPANNAINVSYVLSQPSWGRVADRWNKTFTLKTVISIGGVDRTAQKDVTLSAPTTLPPNVRT